MGCWTRVVKWLESEMSMFNQFSDMHVGRIVLKLLKSTWSLATPWGRKSPFPVVLVQQNSFCGSVHNAKQSLRYATGAPNSCSCADLAVFDIDKSTLQAERNTFQEMRYFGRYRDSCYSLQPTNR